jgi:hypothetical protein
MYSATSIIELSRYLFCFVLKNEEVGYVRLMKHSKHVRRPLPEKEKPARYGLRSLALPSQSFHLLTTR